jgi:hypothetical protein
MWHDILGMREEQMSLAAEHFSLERSGVAAAVRQNGER